MIPRRIAALSPPSSRSLSRFASCQRPHRCFSTDTAGPPRPSDRDLLQPLPLPSASEGPLLVDFEEQVKHASKSPVRLAQSDKPLTKLESYYVTKAAREEASKLGAEIEPHYKPHELITNPPYPRDITLELLLASGAHLGHATALWNPGNQRYIFGIRQGIHLISLDVIAAHLRRAAKIVHGVSRSGGNIIFVGTREGQERAIVEAARRTRGYHITERWVPGTITNKEQLLADQKLRVLDNLDQEIKLTDQQMKVVHEQLARAAESRRAAGAAAATPDIGAAAVDTLQVPTGYPAARPDLVVCLNPMENQTMLQECAQYRIPTIGIIDTDVDPTCVTYPIPANDDSLRCVQLIAGILGRAGQEGRLARYEAEILRRKRMEKTRNTQRELERRAQETEAKAEMEKEAEEAATEARIHQLEQSATPINPRAA